MQICLSIYPVHCVLPLTVRISISQVKTKEQIAIVNMELP